MKRRANFYAILGMMIFGLFSPSKAESDEIDNRWRQHAADIDTKWEQKSAGLDEKWDRLEKEQAAKWALFQQRVEQKWDDFVRSTNKDWVDYNSNLDTRSRVDFEKGRIQVEAVVPEAEPGAAQRALKLLKSQVEKLFRSEDSAGKKILSGQVDDPAGRRIDEKSAGTYFDQALKPEISPSPKPSQSRDGKVRRKYTLEIALVPGHIQIRARRYVETVRADANRFRLDPRLVMAVIHSESCFNPCAESPAGALGLMQIVPRMAGRDAYRFIYGKDILLTEQYLMDPARNIELGCAYLHLLKYKHFQDITGETKNRYVAICGYNWGPGSMRTNIIDKHDISAMSETEVFRLLRTRTPLETREYIKRVTDFMPGYGPFFSAP